MSTNKLKEDLELIASLTASTAGFLKNNVNGMMVGDGKFIKAEMKPQDVIQKAKDSLITEYKNNGEIQPPRPPVQSLQQPPVQPLQQPTLQLFSDNNQQEIKPVNPQENPNQLMFNFDNSPTAQNIYYKLNYIVERLDKLTERVNNLSEHIVKKKLVKKEEKV